MHQNIMNKNITITIGAILVGGAIGASLLFGQEFHQDVFPTDNVGGATLSVLSNYSEEFSGKTFYSFVDIPDGVIIYSSVFNQPTPDTHIFREDMTSVTFICASLDNVFIPEGNIVMNEVNGGTCGSQIRFEVQNDLQEWIVDEENNPIEPIAKEDFLKKGISIDPEDIPTKKLKAPILTK